jgi:hypothetical protein
LGRSERAKLESHLTVLIAHLLKRDFQPERHGSSWEATIKVQRRTVDKMLGENPSLRPWLLTELPEIYENARLYALAETNLPDDAMPADCPYQPADLWTQE